MFSWRRFSNICVKLVPRLIRDQLLPFITLVEKYDNIANTIDELNKTFDFVIVGVNGRNNREMITSIRVSQIY